MVAGSDPTLADYLKAILTWPLGAYDYSTKTDGSVVPLVAGLAVSYYWAGGLPNQGQPVMQLVQAYALGGVVAIKAGVPVDNS